MKIHSNISLLGFIIFMVIITQTLSGVMLALSLVPECMIIPSSREEEDLENIVIDDFFWLHERGVDLLFTTLLLHLFRKFYLGAFQTEQELAWKGGLALFLILHVVIFLGLVLCCSHLSEVTLTIAANILHTIFFFKGKMYWWIFTDMLLNTDTLLRLAYLHYVIAFFAILLGTVHGVEMHHDWKADKNLLRVNFELNWWFEGLNNEFSQMINLLIIFTIINFMLYSSPEALTYEIFMWGDIGFITDIRFYGVAPHWYFRPYMAWLIVCPSHRIGLGGLAYFFVVLYIQPNLFKNIINTNHNYNLFQLLLFYFFFMCLLYTTTFLPYGRFYNQIGGNDAMWSSYIFIFIYLGTTWRVLNYDSAVKYVIIR